MSYNPKVRTAEGVRRRLRSQTLGVDHALRARMAETLAAANCGDSRHRTETDARTGDEVCRFCGTVVEG
jgi:hypothetical protein